MRVSLAVSLCLRLLPPHMSCSNAANSTTHCNVKQDAYGFLPTDIAKAMFALPYASFIGVIFALLFLRVPCYCLPA